MTVYETIIQNLVKAKIPSPRLEARLLLAHVLHQNENDASILQTSLTQSQEKTLRELLSKRIEKHYPLDKLIGHKGFYKYDFAVSEDVLSPRPDTEILVEKAVQISNQRKIQILDLGTGSGCILLSLLKENEQATGVGVDISAAALNVARQNAQQLGVNNRVSWLNTSWFEENFINQFSHPFELIVSNPPYIPASDIAELEAEVKDHDPLAALSGGRDGLTSYRRLAEIAPQLLAEEGTILLECGINQAQQVAEMFVANGLTLTEIVADLQGIDRCIILKK